MTSSTLCGSPPPALKASPRARAVGQRVGQREVGAGGIGGVQEVALRRAVRADRGPPPGEQVGDRTRHEARAVLVAAAVDVAEARRRHRQPVGRPVRAGDDVRGGLRGLVGTRRPQRRALGQRQRLRRSVGVLGRGHDRPADVAGTAGLEQRPGAAHVGLEGLERRAVAGADGRRGRRGGRRPPPRPRRSARSSAPASTTSPSTTSHSRSSPSSTSTQPGRGVRRSTVTRAPRSSSALREPAADEPVGAGHEHRATGDRRAVGRAVVWHRHAARHPRRIARGGCDRRRRGSAASATLGSGAR